MPVTVTARPPAGARPGLPIDPRIRQRRIEVRRAEGRRRLKVLSAVLTVLVLGAALYGITRSPLLAVHHVEVTGIAHTSRAEVMVAAGLEHRRLMVEVHPGRAAARLVALPWVATAVVSRRWPATVRIRVTERTPIATVAAGVAQVAEIDGTGRVLAIRAALPVPPPPGPAPPVPAPPAARPFPSRPAARSTVPPVPAPPVPVPPAAGQLPVIAGLEPPGPPGSTLGRRALDALALVAAIGRSYPAPLAARLATVTVGVTGDLSALVTPGVTVRLGTADQLDAKLLALRTLLERVDLQGIALVDVRVPDTPVLTRQSPPTTVSTTPRG